MQQLSYMQLQRGCIQPWRAYLKASNIRNRTMQLPLRNPEVSQQHFNTSEWHSANFCECLPQPTPSCCLPSVGLCGLVYCRTLHPLARVPGPVWPAVSRAWLSCPYFNVSYSRRNTNRRLVSERAHVHPYSGEGPMVTGFIFRLGEELVQKINHTNMILANSVPDVHRRC
jgi:hypothetical protein